MPYRNIFVANRGILKVSNEQLIVNNGEEHSFPIEDIRCVLIEDNRTSISAGLISRLANHGVTLIVCNDFHMPEAALVSLNAFSRRLRQIELQFSQTKPFLKNLWKNIVVAKITNQAKVAELCDKKCSQKLLSLTSQVKSGDTSNVEGRAALIYFKSLFGSDFTRDDEIAVNAALNYGYAILRAYIARTICLYGFEPSLGIHHKSELNRFNLADDIIEPFRPVVDLYVCKHLSETEDFGSAQKAELLRLLNTVMLYSGKKYSVANCVELVVQNIIACYKKEKTDLVLPKLIDLEYYEYE